MPDIGGSYMSSCIEFEGKNLEQAIKKACEKLNIREEDLKHEVISYGSTGIFGLVGAKKARIRVLLQEKTVTEPVVPTEIQAHPLESGPPPDAAALTDDETFGKEVVQKLVDYIMPEATVWAEKKNNRVSYHVNSKNSAVLIGKKGQTLEAIQHIVEKIISQKMRDPKNGDAKGNEKLRIQIDIEGYLENRKENLSDLASRLAAKVNQTGKPVTVGHMTAHDRRIVHMSLKNNHSVRTQSMGEGFLKKLVIFPRKAPANKKVPQGPFEKE
jgi:spoIIIJ-associated protein